MRQPFWCFWAEGIMGKGAAFLLFAASKNHATSETAPLGRRMAQPSPSRLRRATSPERERLWRWRKVYSLTADFFLSLNSKDETCRFCQGLSLSGKASPGRGKMSPPGDKKGKSCRRRRLRGFVPKATLSVTAMPCHLSRKGEALAGAESLQLNGRLLFVVK